ncbi:hypothetical protein [Xenorhabdus kozodoii]|uniref:Uncharacterized protein n=1 Tax=Xenorhabdus kozodoii TaxID=351676 RepID=A0A2D0L4J7_9GAMM|nr:hypothetical protein [Xenorhabdus kozodoii]PHM70613.1 hypothetical protein Xkoz_03053 [Xenorhabdus kozodoii]
MVKIFYSFCLLFCSSSVLAQPDVQYPPAIPAIESSQQAMREELLAIPTVDRTEQQWRQLSLVSITLLGTTDSPTMAEMESTINQARQKLPEDALLIAIQGSLFCIQAGQENIDSMKAMSLVNKGFRQLDRAVMMEPYDIGPRLQRAITASKTPTFLGKRSLAEQDLNYLLTVIPVSKKTSELRAMLLFDLAEIVAEKDKAQAIKLWQQAASLDAGVWSERAQKQL